MLQRGKLKCQKQKGHWKLHSPVPLPAPHLPRFQKCFNIKPKVPKSSVSPRWAGREGESREPPVRLCRSQTHSNPWDLIVPSIGLPPSPHMHAHTAGLGAPRNILCSLFLRSSFLWRLISIPYLFSFLPTSVTRSWGAEIWGDGDNPKDPDCGVPEHGVFRVTLNL